MKMIDNIKINDSTKRRIIYPLFFMLLSGFISYNIYKYVSPSYDFKVRTYKVTDGWGYQIEKKDKVIIDQPFIPVVPGKKGFPSRKSAWLAGKMVKKRIVHHQSPALTHEDMLEIGLDSLGRLK